jgi:hypothetical protein
MMVIAETVTLLVGVVVCNDIVHQHQCKCREQEKFAYTPFHDNKYILLGDTKQLIKCIKCLTT